MRTCASERRPLCTGRRRLAVPQPTAMAPPTPPTYGPSRSELWKALATPLRGPLVVAVPSETLVAVAAAHGVVDVVALARCDWAALWPYLFLLFPIPLYGDPLAEMALFFFCSVMHFASDANVGQDGGGGWAIAAAIASSLFMHLVLLRLHALDFTHTAMLVVSIYLCFFHVGALLVTLYEQHDVLTLAAVALASGLAAADPRRSIAVAFGGDAYNPQTGTLRVDPRVLRIISCHALSTQLRKARGYVAPKMLHDYFKQKLKLS